MLNSLATTDYN